MKLNIVFSLAIFALFSSLPAHSSFTPPAFTARTSNSLQLEWSQPSGLPGEIFTYSIKKSLNPYSFPQILSTTTSTSFTDIGLQDNSIYYYSIQATGSLGTVDNTQVSGSMTRRINEDDVTATYTNKNSFSNIAMLGDSTANLTATTLLKQELESQLGISVNAISMPNNGGTTTALLSNQSGAWDNTISSLTSNSTKILFIRMATNDIGAGLTPLQSATNLITISNNLMAAVPSLEKTIILMHVGGWEFVDPSSRRPDAGRHPWNKEFQSILYSSGFVTSPQIQLGPLSDTYAFGDHPEFHTYPDALHPNNAGYTFLAKNEVSWLLSSPASAPEPITISYIMTGLIFLLICRSHKRSLMIKTNY